MPMKDFSAWTTSPLAILSVWRGDLISEDGWRLLRNWRLLKDSRSNEKSFAAPGPAPTWRASPLLLTASPVGSRDLGDGGSSLCRGSSLEPLHHIAAISAVQVLL